MGFRLAHSLITALLLVCLANDVSPNRGPVSLEFEVKEFTRARGLKVAHMFHRVMMAFKYLHGQIDFSFNIKSSKDVHDYNTRRKMDVRLPLAKRNWGQQKFVYSIFRDWNTLDPSIRDVMSFSLFRTKAKNVTLI